jgi:alanine dehydrogenase
MANQRREPASNPLMCGAFYPRKKCCHWEKVQKLSIGIQEKKQIEQRVSLTPEAVEVLIGSGHEVILESQAGEGARYTNNDYSECGAFIVENKKLVLGADVILKVSPLEIKEIEMLKGNQVILSSIHLSRQSEEYVRGLMDKSQPLLLNK